MSPDIGPFLNFNYFILYVSLYYCWNIDWISICGSNIPDSLLKTVKQLATSFKLDTKNGQQLLSTSSYAGTFV